jgi:hypothetical protein
VILHHKTQAALYAHSACSISKITSLALTQSGKEPVSLTPQDLGAGEVIGLSGHGQGHVQPARADAQHAHPGRPGSVAESEPIRVPPGRPKRSMCTWWLMPLPGGLNHNAVARSHGAQIYMVVRVLEISLQEIVVHILHAGLGAHPVKAHGLKLQHHHGAGGVLGKGVIYA